MARLASWPTSALTNLEFQIPVTGSTTPNSGLDVRSDWLWPHAGQYWAAAGSSELQYQHEVTAGILHSGFQGRAPLSRVPPPQGPESPYDRPGRAFRTRHDARAERTSGHPVAAPKLRPADRPEARGGGSPRPHRLRASAQHRALGATREREDHPGRTVGGGDQGPHGRHVGGDGGGRRSPQGGGRGACTPA